MEAIELFNNWATNGKDKGMELNHADSVDYMLGKIPNSITRNLFSFLDIGCGNGWVVKRMSKNKNCNLSIGIDGSENMINKAVLSDKMSSYYQLDINNLNFATKVDVVFSMEVIYYLDKPATTLTYIINNVLKSKGFFIIGLDHYKENKCSLSWPVDLGVFMHTLSINEWVNILERAGLSNVKYYQFGSNEQWAGTLVLSGVK